MMQRQRAAESKNTRRAYDTQVKKFAV